MRSLFSLELLSRRNKFGTGTGTGTPLRLVSSLLWKMCCRLEWECEQRVSGWAALGCYKAVGKLWLGLSAYIQVYLAGTAPLFFG